MNTEYTYILIDHIEKNRNKTKIAKKVYYWYGYDNLSNIITDGSVWWYGLTWSGATMPKYVFEYIKRYMKKHGFIYLFDIPVI